MRSPLKSLLPVLALALVLSFAGCVRMPEAPVPVSQGTATGNKQEECGRDKPAARDKVPLPAPKTAGLNPRGFTVLNWGTFAGEEDGRDRDLAKLIQPSDVILLQDSHLIQQLQGLLQAHNFNLDLATALTNDDAETGVLTAARIKPDYLYSFSEKEPIGSIPKTVLITRYPLSGTKTSLLVANVHMTNFAIELSAYRRQLEKTARILSRHQGPVILSGNLNTWNERRMEVVAEIAGKLNMKPVVFAGGRMSDSMEQPVDHIYYRGLIPVESTMTRVKPSDHSSLLVTFRLDETP